MTPSVGGLYLTVLPVSEDCYNKMVCEDILNECFKVVVCTKRGEVRVQV